MIMLKHAKGIKHRLGLKMIRQDGFTQAEVYLHLAKILNAVENDGNILYDFEALEYCQKRIREIRGQSGIMRTCPDCNKRTRKYIAVVAGAGSKAQC